MAKSKGDERTETVERSLTEENNSLTNHQDDEDDRRWNVETVKKEGRRGVNRHCREDIRIAEEAGSVSDRVFGLERS